MQGCQAIILLWLYFAWALAVLFAPGPACFAPALT